ncbi:Alpha/beta hydrolase family-domain-containing protein [Bombardia bombarda]|uniref:Alpha/beta hydrolase family-domain-containing protein n=1 Tax=Bombardia bombarda TaxID=252184 RepID=A0AA40C943_9PEZI|nr:Alpha/beta hydrolase family-domain-containing protein [Bombardia bombarda]
MASSVFDIKEHVVEAQHIREYPHATSHSQEEVLHLAIKQYTPKNNPNPQPGDVTIIASHANGFVKELYEPLWEDMVQALGKRGVRVRSIWIADVAWQGQSGIINADKLGNDPSWLDHARDLLHVVNHFRHDMPRPLVGVGHSFGANIMVNLAYLHPRLLSSLVMLDPVLSRFQILGPDYGFQPMKLSAYRRDLWPSRADAVAGFRRAKFYASWDPRVFARWAEHGLREVEVGQPPSDLLHPDAKPPAVTLTTSRHMEAFTYYRPQAQVYDAAGKRVIDKSRLVDAAQNVLDDKTSGFAFYRPEGPATNDRLPGLRPGVLWLFGEHSDVNPPDVRQEKMELTGVGIGGSGGEKAGRVKQVTIKGFGHLVPLERTTVCAEHAAEFVAGDLEVWREEDREFQSWARRSDAEKQMLDEDWKRWLGPVKKKGKLIFSGIDRVLIQGQIRSDQTKQNSQDKYTPCIYT